MIPIETLCNDFQKWLSGPNFINPYSKLSIKAYTAEVRRYLTFLDFEGIEDIADATAYLAQSFLFHGKNGKETSKTTRTVRMTALEHFYEWASYEGICSENRIREIKVEKQRNRGGRGGSNAKRLPPVLSWDEQDRLLNSVANLATIAGVRNHATIGILLDTGLRASEVCTLAVEDAQQYLKGHLRVTGKGNKERLIRFEPEHTAAVQTWLKIRQRLTPHSSNYLLLSNRSTPMQPVVLYHEIRTLLSSAGIRKPQMGPHLLRHTAASRWLAMGMDMVQVRDNLGHGDLTITSRYAHLLVSEG